MGKYLPRKSFPSKSILDFNAHGIAYCLEMARAQLFAIIFGIHAFRGQRSVPTKGPGDSRMRGFVGNKKAKLPHQQRLLYLCWAHVQSFLGCTGDTPIVRLPSENAYPAHRRHLQLFPCAPLPSINLSRPPENSYELAATHAIKI